VASNGRATGGAGVFYHLRRNAPRPYLSPSTPAALAFWTLCFDRAWFSVCLCQHAAWCHLVNRRCRCAFASRDSGVVGALLYLSCSERCRLYRFVDVDVGGVSTRRNRAFSPPCLAFARCGESGAIPCLVALPFRWWYSDIPVALSRDNFRCELPYRRWRCRRFGRSLWR